MESDYILYFSNYNYNILIQKGCRAEVRINVLYCIELIIEYSKVLAVFREATE